MARIALRPRPILSAGASLCKGGPAGLLVLAALVGMLVLPPAVCGQEGDLLEAMRRTPQVSVKDTLQDNRAPVAPWTVVAGEVVLGTALAAGAGYGMGLLAELFCDECDAGEPGGDTPGLLTGVPAGAFAGVWFVGRFAPPSGRLGDTLVGAMAGTAVFTAYGKILEEQSDLMRWAGVALPAALAATGWNRSRFLPEPELSWHRPEPTGWGKAEPTLELRLFAVQF